MLDSNLLNQHALKWGEIYNKHHRSLYEDFAKSIAAYLTTELKDLIKESKFKYHTIEGREKAVDKFIQKAAKPSIDDPSKPKYPDPLSTDPEIGITDLAGSRIITFFIKDIPLLEDFIEKRFTVVEKKDKFKGLIDSEKFGYHGIHYIVRVCDNTFMTGKPRFENLLAEIQIKTILEHAWAEIEHDLYDLLNHSNSTPEDKSDHKFIKRRFQAMAGLLEIADREFQALKDLQTNIDNNEND